MFLLAFGGASCATLAARPTADCPPKSLDGSHPYSDSSRDFLAGTFDLQLVWISPGAETGRPQIERSRLTLTAVDSATRIAAMARTIGHERRADLRFVGERVRSDDSYRQTAEVDDGVPILGCRDCTDASPTVLEVVGVGPDGFLGLWRNYQTGIGRVMDRSGKPAPDPAGYFCARRRSTRGPQPPAA